MILIKNGRCLDPVTGLDAKKDILIRDEKIEWIRDHILENDIGQLPHSGSDPCQEIDAEGLTIVPGLMDAHVHFRDPGFTEKEDIRTGTAAAKRGGFTSVVCMANTKPAVDNPETLAYVLEKGKATGIHLYQDSTITRGLKGQELVDMQEMVRAGAAGFTDDGIPLMNEELLTQAMLEAKKLNKPVSLHEEDPLFIRGAGVNMGRVSDILGYGGAANAAEDVMTARDCMIALYTGAKVCIQHISSANSVELVRAAKKLGARVYAEATPHHFTLTEDAVLRYGNNARMNPPLRTEKDRQAILEGLADGTIDIIVTDHAPHTAKEKSRPLPKAPSGIIGLETSLGLGIRSLVNTGTLTLMELIRKMSTAPAELYELPPASIQEGVPADLTIFGEQEEWLVDFFISKASNSPFLGWTIPGKIHFTICNGKAVYRG